jgi:hypothetical protein
VTLNWLFPSPLTTRGTAQVLHTPPPPLSDKYSPALRELAASLLRKSPGGGKRHVRQLHRVWWTL